MSSFLDSTGLGTFWSKVKGYMNDNYVKVEDITAPVTGCTDILTPINLLPNSDFSRSGGYPATFSIDSISDNLGATTFPIAENTYLYAYRGTFENVTVARATNAITITATLKSRLSATENPSIGVASPFRTSGGPFTFYAEQANVTGIADEDHYASILINVGSTVHYSNNTAFTGVSIRTLNANSGFLGFSFGLRPSVATGTTITFTLKNRCAYEGSFKNPHIYKSLDVQPFNQFALISDIPVYPSGAKYDISFKNSTAATSTTLTDYSGNNITLTKSGTGSTVEYDNDIGWCLNNTGTYYYDATRITGTRIGSFTLSYLFKYTGEEAPGDGKDCILSVDSSAGMQVLGVRIQKTALITVVPTQSTVNGGSWFIYYTSFYSNTPYKIDLRVDRKAKNVSVFVNNKLVINSFVNNMSEYSDFTPASDNIAKTLFRHSGITQAKLARLRWFDRALSNGEIYGSLSSEPQKP